MTTNHSGYTHGRQVRPGADCGPLVFALGGLQTLGSRVAAALGVALADHEERDFEDGEHKGRPLQSVRGRDVFVLQGLVGDEQQSVNDRLCRLLFFVATVRDAGARSVTVITPYICYARKDRRTKPRDPVSLRYLAQLFEAVGTDCVVTLEVHNPAAFDNAFRCPTLNLDADAGFSESLLRLVGDSPLVVMSPDPGGVKRAERLRQALAERSGQFIASAFVDKKRSEGRITGTALVGDVRSRAIIIVDDMIVSGATLLRATRACREAGAKSVIAAATHGLFAPGAEGLFGPDGPDRLVVTDSVATPATSRGAARLERIPIAPLLAAAIRRLHQATAAQC